MPQNKENKVQALLILVIVFVICASTLIYEYTHGALTKYTIDGPIDIICIVSCILFPIAVINYL